MPSPHDGSTGERGGPSRRAHAARIVPFALYLLFLVLGQVVPWARLGIDARWLYALQISCVAASLAWFAREYGEFAGGDPASRRHWLGSIALGVAVFLAWIGLAQGVFVLGDSPGFDPRRADGSLDWLLAGIRLFGAAVIVPPMEELFWRSYLMRLLDRRDFPNLDPRRVSTSALLLSSIGFGFEHNLWAAGILAGLAYGGLYRWSGSLWTATLAHALTNLLLGVHVLRSGSWQFW